MENGELIAIICGAIGIIGTILGVILPFLIPMSISVKEQGEKLARLEAKVDNLDSRTERLENEIRQIDRAVARLEAHYSTHGVFLEPQIKKKKGEK